MYIEPNGDLWRHVKSTATGIELMMMMMMMMQRTQITAAAFRYIVYPSSTSPRRLSVTYTMLHDCYTALNRWSSDLLCWG